MHKSCVKHTHTNTRARSPMYTRMRYGYEGVDRRKDRLHIRFLLVLTDNDNMITVLEKKHATVVIGAHIPSVTLFRVGAR